MVSDAVIDPVKVKLSDDHDRNKLSIGERYWIENDDKDTPRKGILIEGREYIVDASDRVVKHFIDGGTLDVLEDSGGNSEKGFKDKLKELPYVGGALSDKIVDEFTTWKEFKENVDIEFLKELNGVGASKAEDILKEVDK